MKMNIIYFKLKLVNFYTKFKNRNLENKMIQFYSSFINKGDLCFDIGANIGNRVNILNKIGTQIVAVEPQISCYNYLIENYSYDNIKILNVGLGEHEGYANFYMSNASTLSSMSKRWIEEVSKDRFKDYIWYDPIKIEITTLNCLIENFGTPKFIKIDVEGYELEILKGLKYQINYISFEYTVPEACKKIIECIEEIKKYNSEIEINHCVAENMKFEFKDWKNVSFYKSYIFSKQFIKSSFGDIYVRVKRK